MPPRCCRLASPATATAPGALVLVLLGVTVALAVLIHQLTALNVATGLTIPLAYAAVGVVVARHQPRNPVGWIPILNPVRWRVQKAVDRRFNRVRYDADQTAAAFAARLKDAVNLESVQDDLASVVTKALEPAHVSVWMSERK